LAISSVVANRAARTPASDDYVRQAEGECHIDVSVHLIISDPTPEVLGQELPALLKAGYTSFKVFMTYDDLVLNDRQLLDVFSWRDCCPTRRRCWPKGGRTNSGTGYLCLRRTGRQRDALCFLSL
jgi:hypothetical protein